MITTLESEEIEEPDDLDDRCVNNKLFKTCGTACPLTCENYRNPPSCADVCVTDCFCPHGMVETSDGRCVPPFACLGEFTCVGLVTSVIVKHMRRLTYTKQLG